MATYKVLQDIEAEDKLLGPLTLKQFVFAGIAVTLMFIGWFIGRSTSYAAMLIFLIPAAPFIFLAAPLGRDQPNDVWLAARLRFFFKPRVRQWDQTGIEELVTITAPKTEEHVYTDGLSKTEVKSRLKALSDTIDSRGWAVKNVTSSPVTQPIQASDDRLVGQYVVPLEVADIDIKASDDMFDTSNNAAQHFTQLMDEQASHIHEQAIAQMHPANTNPTVIHPSADGRTARQAAAKPQQPTVHDETSFLNQLHQRQARFGADTTTPKNPQPTDSSEPQIQPISHAAHYESTEPQIAVADFTDDQPAPPAVPAALDISKQPKQPTEQPHADPAIINQLATNDDFSVATIAGQAKRAVDDVLHSNEIINLHPEEVDNAAN